MLGLSTVVCVHYNNGLLVSPNLLEVASNTLYHVNDVISVACHVAVYVSCFSRGGKRVRGLP